MDNVNCGKLKVLEGLLTVWASQRDKVGFMYMVFR